MSSFVFLYAKGRFVANAQLPLTNDVFAAELYNSTSLEADSGLQDRQTFGDITTGGSVKCDSTNYPARTDASCGTTNASATVTDSSIVALDAGKGVTGPGIPPGTYVGTVTAGTSFLLSSSQTSQVNVNATATATVSLVIGGRVPLNGITTSYDTTAETVTIDSNDIVFPSVGGATNHALGKCVVGYDSDTTVSGVHDANVVPQTGHDFPTTPDGSTITATVNGLAAAQ